MCDTCVFIHPQPGNIFLQGPNNEVKIGDFGLARSVEGGYGATSNMHGHLSAGLGTSLYAAPEQLEGHDYCSKVSQGHSWNRCSGFILT